MRSPLAPTVYRRSRQQRGVVPPVFYISKSRGDYFDQKKYFHVSFNPSFWFWLIWWWCYENITHSLFTFCKSRWARQKKTRKKIMQLKWPKYQKLKDENMGWRKNKKEKFRILGQSLHCTETLIFYLPCPWKYENKTLKNKIQGVLCLSYYLRLWKTTV